MATPGKRYSRTKEVKLRYGGVSDMWITRRLRDDGFPSPVYFGTKERFFADEELDAWDRLMIQRGVDGQKPKPVPPRRGVQS